jgi:hypothetical protein
VAVVTVKVVTADQAFANAAKNKNRRYPTANVGKRRLIPFAHPTITTERRIPSNATFFVAGDCYARSVEKALLTAGKEVLSSPTNLDLPGNARDQFNRYTIYNLDSVYNEFNWALRPDDEAMNASLIESGGELVDLQIHWTFGHAPKLALQYRKTFASSFARAAEADVIILVAGGVEQWYDNETGLYINGMAPSNLIAEYPGRFDLHILDIEDCIATLQKTCELLISTSKKKNPLILIANTPGADTSTFMQNDALQEHMYSRAVQRIAVEKFVNQVDYAEYLPAMEHVFLSERRTVYLENSYNHIRQGSVERTISDMLLQYQGPSAGQSLIDMMGQSDGMLCCGEEELALPIIAKHQETYGDDKSINPVHAHLVLTRIYQQTKAHAELQKLHTDFFKHGKTPKADTLEAKTSFTKEHSFRISAATASRYGTTEEVKELLALGKKRKQDPETLAILKERLKRGAPKPTVASGKANDTGHGNNHSAGAMVEISRLLRSNPAECVLVAREKIAAGVVNNQIIWMYALALRHTEDPELPKVLEEIASSDSEFAPNARQMLGPLKS